MAYSARSLRILSVFHAVIGCLSFITGQVSMKVDSPYYNGVFGMGLWIGGWIFLTALAGSLSARRLENYCRIGIFLGCCLVGIVILAICSIIIGTVVITHYRFESTVTRSYYKDKGTFGRVSHEDYFKPEEYFINRRKEGRIGLAMYGSLLAIFISDILVCCVCIYVCRDLCRSEEAANGRGNVRRAWSAQRRAGNPNPGVPVGVSGQNWVELAFPGSPQSLQTDQYQQFYSPFKLPNYAELYPEGIINNNTAQDGLQLEPRSPGDPPPEYTPSADSSLPLHPTLPGSSVEFPLPPSYLPTELSVVVNMRSSSISSASEEHPGVFPEDLGNSVISADAPAPLTPSDLATIVSDTIVTSSECTACSAPLAESPRLVPADSSVQPIATLPNSITTSAVETFVNPTFSRSECETTNSENVCTTSSTDKSGDSENQQRTLERVGWMSSDE